MNTPRRFARIMGICLVGLLLLTSLAGMRAAPSAEYRQVKSQAEELFAEGSYGRAHELYVKADALKLPQAQARWVDFRLADTLWRSQAATRTADTTKLDKARTQLEAMIRGVERTEDRDRVWAEVTESLGDYWWTRRHQRNWRQAWQHYQKALDFWAGHRDIDLARKRYLTIIWTIASPPGRDGRHYYGYYGNHLPIDVLDNVLKIVQTDDERAHAHYLTAMTLKARGSMPQRLRVTEEFELALKAGRSTDWYDDALFHLAEWLAQSGRIKLKKDGNWQSEPDYVEALKFYRRLVKEYKKGQTRYYDQANNRIDNITGPVVGVRTSNIFLPNSEIEFHLNWRNVKTIDLAVYKIDMTRDVYLISKDTSAGNWMYQIDLGRRPKVKSQKEQTADTGEHKPDSRKVRLTGKLPTGAYLIEATAGGQSSRDLILVTDATLVLKTSGRQALVYFCDAIDGSPLVDARVTLWQRYRIEGERPGKRRQYWVWKQAQPSKDTNADGICVFDLDDSHDNIKLLAAAALGDKQAFSIGNAYGYHRDHQPWRIYAFTDRPAYRPDETVHWKFTARRYDGSVYSTPAGESVKFRITDPRGTKIKEDTVKLNAFGSGWGELELTKSMPLGEYRVEFFGQDVHIGNATLFRLEEYKLPEFKVVVETPKENGRPKTFRLGDTVEVIIAADYYFGGPVADANVEVLVYQKPFHHTWQPPKEFPWFYDDTAVRYRRYGTWRGQIVKRETLKTDAAGKARLKFDTPRNNRQDFEYSIEARVTDASRREIVGSGNVRVTRQQYYVHLKPAHNIYRPSDKVELEIKTIDANDQPVPAEGTVTITRDYWGERWISPKDVEISGDELKAMSRSRRIADGWKLKHRGYRHEEILTRQIKTDAQGEAELAFTPKREGYYRIVWADTPADGLPIRGETTVHVATNKTTDTGYRHGGVEIIVDKDTFRAGQKASVMLSVPTSGRYVLFSVEGEDLYSYRLIHITGTVKLIELPITETHVPNIFLSAAMVSDGEFFVDTKRLVVPPVKHFLKVTVDADREQYQPQQSGTLTVTTLDHNGKPVAAEVALGLVDESVYYIQQDYAPDPRQFYYGAKRAHRIQTNSTYQQKRYAKLVEDEKKRLIDVLHLQKSEIANQPAEQRVRKAGAMPMNAVADFEGGELAFERSSMDSLMSVMKGHVAGPAAAPPTPTEEPAVQVRTDFRATAFWQPDIVTDKDGKATVEIKFPDTLTSWKATARVATAGNQFGIATTAARTKKPLIVRLQAPRFFVVGDRVTISAVINNNTGTPITVRPSLQVEGLTFGEEASTVEPIEIAANSESRVDWLVAAEAAGTAKLTVTARSEEYADAMAKTYPVCEHGIEKFIAKSGKLRGDDITIKLDIPKERKRESTTLTVQVTPSLAVTMLDALPYLIDYPYGCTEQTMSRFLPAAIVTRTLDGLGLHAEDVAGRIFGGIVGEHAAKTHPDGKKDLHKLDDMVKRGLDRLYDLQHGDGGWGWWKKSDSDHFMTAYVVWGLSIAGDAGIEIKQNALARAAKYLDEEIVEEEDNYDMQAWMLHALSAAKKSYQITHAGKAFENLWKNRDKLNAYTRALLALSAHQLGLDDKARTLTRNLENGVKIDTTPDTSVIQRGGQTLGEGVIATAHWGEDGIYRRWSDGGVEATAFALRAMLAIDPGNKLIEPVTNWLIKNRRGAQWSNTRDTAITVLAFNDYLRISGELEADLEYQLSVNGKLIAKKKITPADVLSAPSRFDIDRKLIKDGVNEIRIIRTRGSGPIYFAAHAKFFSLEEPITPAGSEIFVRRQYHKLVGRPTLLKGYVYETAPLNDGNTVTSGQRIEVVVTIEAKNNYEYLVFEDLKPAGFEAVEIRSGQNLYAKQLKSGTVEQKFVTGKLVGTDKSDYTGRQRWVYQELRDRKVAMFIDKLPEGIWEIRYHLRAEVPGKFHALPLTAHAMYVPEIRANGAEIRVVVEDGQ